MESLLEYHGFLIKVFEEPYMVKEGPFLNGDKDYPTRCSKLVDMKKSGMIIEDVLLSAQVMSPTKSPKEVQIAKTTTSELKVTPSSERKRPVHDISSVSERKRPVYDISAVEVFSPVHSVDEEMTDSAAVLSPKENKQIKPMTEIPIVSQWSEDEPKVAGFHPLQWGFSLPKPQPSKVGNEGKSNYETAFNFSPQRNIHSDRKEMPLQFVSQPVPQDKPLDAPYNFAVENSISRSLVNKVEEEESVDVLQEDESEEVPANYQQEEIAEAKLKLILRFGICFASFIYSHFLLEVLIL